MNDQSLEAEIIAALSRGTGDSYAVVPAGIDGEVEHYSAKRAGWPVKRLVLEQTFEKKPIL